MCYITNSVNSGIPIIILKKHFSCCRPNCVPHIIPPSLYSPTTTIMIRNLLRRLFKGHRSIDPLKSTSLSRNTYRLLSVKAETRGTSEAPNTFHSIDKELHQLEPGYGNDAEKAYFVNSEVNEDYGGEVEPVELKFSEENATQTPSLEQSEEHDTSIPWYLRQDVASNLHERAEIKIPDIPANSPPHLSDFLNLLAKDLGIDELKIFDIASLDDTHEFKTNHLDLNFIIIGTGKSERHIYKAATELRTHIKHNYGVVPSIQGMVSSGKTPAQRRRLLKKARKGPSATDNDYGFTANSWILCIHEGVEVHILSAQRRAELNLEQIWCPPEDLHLYQESEPVDYESDNILHTFGRRRGIRRLHTSAREYSTSSNSENLTQILEKLESLPMTVDDGEILQLQHQFNDLFNGTCTKDFDIKSRFYKTIHLARPDLVSFEVVEDCLLQKYTSKVTWSQDMATEKINDITEYTRLLVDSPELAVDSKKASDISLDKLSRFISALYQFSTEEFSMSANPMFLPFLWKLANAEIKEPITSRMVSNIILGKSSFISYNGKPSSHLASNNARDILCLASHHDKIFSTNLVMEQTELILFTYGNCGKWDKFWNEWESSTFLRSYTSSEKIDLWVRLAVYLALTGNKSQAFKFLCEFWKNSSSVSGSFLEAFNEHNHKFNSDAQRDAFVMAVRQMIQTVEGENGQFFDEVKLTLDQIASSQSS